MVRENTDLIGSVSIGLEKIQIFEVVFSPLL